MTGVPSDVSVFGVGSAVATGVLITVTSPSAATATPHPATARTPRIRYRQLEEVMQLYFSRIVSFYPSWPGVNLSSEIANAGLTLEPALSFNI
jgi:hypothetical protein